MDVSDLQRKEPVEVVDYIPADWNKHDAVRDKVEMVRGAGIALLEGWMMPGEYLSLILSFRDEAKARGDNETFFAWDLLYEVIKLIIDGR